jgi:hypothetical protein
MNAGGAALRWRKQPAAGCLMVCRHNGTQSESR